MTLDYEPYIRVEDQVWSQELCDSLLYDKKPHVLAAGHGAMVLNGASTLLIEGVGIRIGSLDHSPTMSVLSVQRIVGPNPLVRALEEFNDKPVGLRFGGDEAEMLLTFLSCSGGLSIKEGMAIGLHYQFAIKPKPKGESK